MSISTKEEFMQAFELDKEIAKIVEHLEFLRHKLNSPSGASISLGSGVQKSRNIYANTDLLADIIDLEEELTLAKNRLHKIEEEIRAAIRPTPSMLRITMTWRYIIRRPWKQIAHEMEVSEMQLMRHHRAALKLLS